jgi:putative phosphoribosyl transferase
MMKDQEIGIPFDSLNLAGTLTLVPDSPGLVIFVHGSGSSRFSSRNKYVAKELQQGGLSTLLFDLLTTEEELIDRYGGSLRFDIGLLTERVVGATTWLRQMSDTHDLRLGYFGASTGAAAALAAAAQRKEVDAVVSRGGRPDLAAEFLPYVIAPTLLIVGADDPTVLHLNKQAF